jgi:hypothetical protein
MVEEVKNLSAANAQLTDLGSSARGCHLDAALLSFDAVLSDYSVPRTAFGRCFRIASGAISWKRGRTVRIDNI